MIYFREKAIGPRILKERAVYVMTIVPGPGITYFMGCSFRKCCRHSIKVNLDATRDLSTMLASASFLFLLEDLSSLKPSPHLLGHLEVKESQIFDMFSLVLEHDLTP